MMMLINQGRQMLLLSSLPALGFPTCGGEKVTAASFTTVLIGWLLVKILTVRWIVPLSLFLALESP